MYSKKQFVEKLMGDLPESGVVSVYYGTIDKSPYEIRERVVPIGDCITRYTVEYYGPNVLSNNGGAVLFSANGWSKCMKNDKFDHEKAYRICRKRALRNLYDSIERGNDIIR